MLFGHIGGGGWLAVVGVAGARLGGMGSPFPLLSLWSLMPLPGRFMAREQKRMGKRKFRPLDNNLGDFRPVGKMS